MNPPSGVFAEIGRQQSRGDDIPCMGFHRQRERRQGRVDEGCVIVAEAALPVGRERIDDPRPLRAIGALAECEEVGDIVRGARCDELLQCGKILLIRTFLQTPAHRGIGFSFAGSKDQRVQGARQEVRALHAAVLVLFRFDGVEVASPGVAVAVPLRMQRLHRRMRAPQLRPMDDEALAIAVEQVVGDGPAQSLAHRPDVGLDDAPPEFAVEAEAELRQRCRRDRQEA